MRWTMYDAGARLFCGYGRRSHLVVAWMDPGRLGGRKDGAHGAVTEVEREDRGGGDEFGGRT